MKNDCETASQTTSTTKEEDILEKSRQMLEESKAKNEQLAEQVRFLFFFFALHNQFCLGQSISTNITKK